MKHQRGRANTKKFADRFSAIGAESRLRIIQSLIAAPMGRKTVGDLQEEIGIPWSTLSHHLQKLRNEGLVTSRRESSFLWYTANAKVLSEMLGFLSLDCQNVEVPLGPRNLSTSRGSRNGKGVLSTWEANRNSGRIQKRVSLFPGYSVPSSPAIIGIQLLTAGEPLVDEIIRGPLTIWKSRHNLEHSLGLCRDAEELVFAASRYRSVSRTAVLKTRVYVNVQREFFTTDVRPKEVPCLESLSIAIDAGVLRTRRKASRRGPVLSGRLPWQLRWPRL